MKPANATMWLIHSNSLSARMLQKRASCLSELEQARGSRFLFRHDRVSFMLAHCLLRHALSTVEPDIGPAEWRFGQQQTGKPKLMAPFDETNLEFNISHCRGLVACVITRGLRCGVDVETDMDRVHRITPLARRCMARQELRDFLRVPVEEQPDEFLKYWTLKEAYAKATGQGLSLDFRLVAFQPSHLPEGHASHDGMWVRGAKWHLWQRQAHSSGQVATCIEAPLDGGVFRPLNLASNVDLVPGIQN